VEVIYQQSGRPKPSDKCKEWGSIHPTYLECLYIVIVEDVVRLAILSRCRANIGLHVHESRKSSVPNRSLVKQHDTCLNDSVASGWIIDILLT
jgi:hypothetical protein